LRLERVEPHKGAMNQLNVSLKHSIVTLGERGWSARRIARELGVNRETVGKYLRTVEGKPAISTSGNPAVLEAKPAISTRRCGRPSSCRGWEDRIDAGMAAGLSAQRIYQDLVREHGFEGSYESIKRYLRPRRQGASQPVARVEVPAGREAQVDFGQGAWVLVEGRRRRPHLFRIVLSHSRKAYSEVVWNQSTENFIRCLENAFRFFGGVTQTLVIDNLRAAVTFRANSQGRIPRGEFPGANSHADIVLLSRFNGANGRFCFVPIPSGRILRHYL
jgi:transposase